MVEDMKGKIRVYARCRPLSTTEKERVRQMELNFSFRSYRDTLVLFELSFMLSFPPTEVLLFDFVMHSFTSVG